MGLTYDPAKRLQNLAKHGVDFVDLEPVFHDPGALTIDSIRQTVRGPEARKVTLGTDDADRVLVVVWVPEGSDWRVISARPASRKERKHYGL